jgi:hypothetical protein
VQDIVQFPFFQDVTDVVLVGWSCGGGVVDCVADLVPERLSRVVDLDVEVVHEGALLSEGWTDRERDQFQEMSDQAARTGWDHGTDTARPSPRP